MRFISFAATTSKSVRPALLACSLAMAAASAQAAPFGISYDGFGVAESGGIARNLPGTVNSRYTVTLIVDNGGTSANDQTWTGADIRCVRWNFRRGGSSVYEQNVSSSAPVSSTDPSNKDAFLPNTGSITTNASGTLTSVFNQLAQNMTPASGTYTLLTPDITTGATPYPPNVAPNGDPYWFIPNSRDVGGLAGFTGVFHLVYSATDIVGFDQELTPGSGTGGGSISTGTNVSSWSAPVALPSDMQCAGQALQSGGTTSPVTPGTGGAAATPVPSLGTGAIVALGLGAASIGALRLRRRKA